MKKILILFNICVLVVGLSACNNKARPDNHFQFATWAAGTELKELNEIVDRVNENANGEYTIEVLSIPSDYYIKISTLIAAGKSPDFYWLTQELLAKYASLGAIEDLTNNFETSETMKPSDFYEGVIESAKHYDKYWGIPWIANPAIVYYNKDIFREAQQIYPELEIPSLTEDWTWPEFIDTVKKVTGIRGNDQYGLVLEGLVNIETFLWAGGGEVVGADEKTIMLDSPKSLKGLGYLNELLTRKTDDGQFITPEYKDIASLGSANVWFEKQRVAMFFGGIQDRFETVIGNMNENDKFELGYAPLPVADDGSPHTFNWTATTVMRKGVKNQDLAYKALEDLTKEFFKWKVAPPLKNIDLEEVISEIAPEKLPMLDTMQVALENARSGHYIQKWNKIDLFYGLYNPMINRKSGFDYINAVNVVSRKARDELNK